jgi:CelD/BcsL family acetyltransferase involved in cellulose biosynthesis
MSAHRWLDLSDAAAVRDWEELASSTKAGPFMRPGWFLAWGKAFGTADIEVAANAGTSLEALVPLIRAKRGLRSPVNEHSPEFSVVGAGPAVTGLAASLLTNKPTTLELLKADQDTAFAVRAAANAMGYRVVTDTMQRSPFLELTEDWDAYEGSLSSSFRQGLRRKKRRLEEEGTLTVDVRDGSEDLESLLDEGYDVESSQWKEEQGTAIASDPVTRAFYTSFSSWAAQQGWLRLVFLRQHDKAIAFRLDVTVDGAYYHVKGGYDPAFGRYSPGLVLQHETVRHAIEAGLSRYEFLGADEPYKLKWTSTCRDRIAVRCFARTPAGQAAWARRTLVAPVVRKLRPQR